MAGYRMVNAKGREMKITEVRYTRKFNLGNYESEDVGVVANLEDSECPVKAIADCKAIVVNGQAPAKKEVAVEVPPVISIVEEKEEVVAKEEAPKEEAPVKKAPTKKKAPAKKKVVKKVKAIAYDNTDDSHRRRMGDLVTSTLGEGWDKVKENRPMVKAASTMLIGKDFIGADGELVETFIAAFKAGLR